VSQRRPHIKSKLTFNQFRVILAPVSHLHAMKGRQVTTRTAEFFIDHHDILHIRMLPDLLVDELDIYDNYLVMRDLSEGRKTFRLFDARAEKWTMTEKAKELAKKNFDHKSAKAIAVIINSGIASSLLNFFKRFSFPEIPTKYFDNKEEAVQWLLEKKESE
jgi:hypothetical protein